MFGRQNPHKFTVPFFKGTFFPLLCKNFRKFNTNFPVVLDNLKTVFAKYSQGKIFLSNPNLKT